MSQSIMLAEQLHLVHVATRDVLHEAIERNDTHGLLIREMIV